MDCMSLGHLTYGGLISSFLEYLDGRLRKFKSHSLPFGDDGDHIFLHVKVFTVRKDKGNHKQKTGVL